MKKLLAAILAISLLTACAANSNTNLGKYHFNPEVNKIVDLDEHSDIIYTFATFEQLEAQTRTRSPETETSIIVFGEVAGGSINRVFDPEQYTGNYVITPFKITSVIFGGQSGLKNGDVINVLEDFYYVTEETPQELENHALGTVIANEYDPMEIGKKYVLYPIKDANAISAVWYNGQSLYVAGGRGAVYCISDDAPKHLRSAGLPYGEIWEKVKAAYGYLAQQG